MQKVSNPFIKDLPKKPVFEKRNAYWIGEKDAITKQYNKRKRFSTKLAPVQASIKRNGDMST